MKTRQQFDQRKKDEISKKFYSEFHSKIKRIPKVPFTVNKTYQETIKCETTNSSGEDEYKIYSRKDHFSMTSFSTYAIVNNVKTGNPICDQVLVKFYSNCSICIIADGCGWGQPSMQAAQRAIYGALEYIEKHIEESRHLKDLGALCVDACQEAHLNIFTVEDSLLKTGTTTFSINMVVSTSKGYYIIITNIGDCRTFLYNKKEHHTLALTGKYKGSYKQMQDSLGRIGAAQSYIPELQKSQIKCIKISEGDIVICSTDGFHDNFDPQFFGKENFKSKEKELDKKMTDMMEQTSIENLDEIAENMSIFICDLTKSSREFMRNNPNKKLPKNAKYPGKMDHTTVCLMKVKTNNSNETGPMNIKIPQFNNDLVIINKENEELLMKEIKDEKDNNQNTNAKNQIQQKTEVGKIKKEIRQKEASPFITLHTQKANIVNRSELKKDESIDDLLAISRDKEDTMSFYSLGTNSPQPLSGGSSTNELQLHKEIVPNEIYTINEPEFKRLNDLEEEEKMNMNQKMNITRMNQSISSTPNTSSTSIFQPISNSLSKSAKGSMNRSINIHDNNNNLNININRNENNNHSNDGKIVAPMKKSPRSNFISVQPIQLSPTKHRSTKMLPLEEKQKPFMTNDTMMLNHSSSSPFNDSFCDSPVEIKGSYDSDSMSLSPSNEEIKEYLRIKDLEFQKDSQDMNMESANGLTRLKSFTINEHPKPLNQVKMPSSDRSLKSPNKRNSTSNNDFNNENDATNCQMIESGSYRTQSTRLSPSQTIGQPETFKATRMIKTPHSRNDSPVFATSEDVMMAQKMKGLMKKSGKSGKLSSPRREGKHIIYLDREEDQKTNEIKRDDTSDANSNLTTNDYESEQQFQLYQNTPISRPMTAFSIKQRSFNLEDF